MKKVLLVDMDNVPVDFASGVARQPEEVLRAHAGRPDGVPGICSLMDPLPDALPVRSASLVDDWARNGVDRFTGDHTHFGSPEFPDRAAVMRHLRERAE
jgi:5'-nucleotidase